MKKRKLLLEVVALVLVAVLSVGGTLAYMSATDEKVTNTFTFGAMTVELTEDQPAKTGEEIITKTETGYAYSNVLPGQKLNKAPEIAVTTSVGAYVFIKVSGFNATLTCDGITNTFTAVTGTTDAYGNGVYYKLVSGTDGAQDLGAIFTKVNVADGDGTATIPNVVIRVGAIQQSGYTVDTAYAAVSTAYFAD